MAESVLVVLVVVLVVLVVAFFVVNLDNVSASSLQSTHFSFVSF